MLEQRGTPGTFAVVIGGAYRTAPECGPKVG